MQGKKVSPEIRNRETIGELEDIRVRMETARDFGRTSRKNIRV